MHRGNLLHRLAKEHVLSLKEIAYKAGYKYPSFFKHINKPDLQFHILLKYGRVLGHDFSVEFPEITSIPGYYNEIAIGQNNDNPAAQLDETWKSKYYLILEKHNQLLENSMQLKEELEKLKRKLHKK